MNLKHVEDCPCVPATPFEALDHSAVVVHAPLRMLTTSFELRHPGGTADTRTTTMIVMRGRVSHDMCPPSRPYPEPQLRDDHACSRTPRK